MHGRSRGKPGDYAPGAQVPGTQYRIVRLLGSGGHGSVYEVEHVFLQARFVLKILHGEHVDEGDLAQRMTREARTLAQLRHSNIVEVHDGGLTAERPPRPYFVMEALNGLPLRDLLRDVRGVGATVGVLASLRIAVGILNGLAFAHESGVIHRDVKPDNIFLHKTSEAITTPKLLDFGIAHVLMGKRLTGQHFIGTPRYAAPEQLRGDPISSRTDIYSAGLVLYEMLTGEIPFAQHRDIPKIVAAHLNETLSPPSRKNRDVPPALDSIVASMLAKDPAERPQRAFAISVALREVRESLEAVRQNSMHLDDFKTEPTPMENVLAERSPEDTRVITEVAASSGGRVNDTIPMAAPPNTNATSPMGALTFETARDGAREIGPALRVDPALATTERSPNVEPGSGGVDRAAATKTRRAQPAHETDVMSADSLMRGLDGPQPRSAFAIEGRSSTPLPVTSLPARGASKPESVAQQAQRGRPWSPMAIAAAIIGVSTVLAALVVVIGNRRPASSSDVIATPAMPSAESPAASVVAGGSATLVTAATEAPVSTVAPIATGAPSTTTSASTPPSSPSPAASSRRNAGTPPTVPRPSASALGSAAPERAL